MLSIRRGWHRKTTRFLRLLLAARAIGRGTCGEDTSLMYQVLRHLKACPTSQFRHLHTLGTCELCIQETQSTALSGSFPRHLPSLRYLSAMVQ
ncbi:hypothetical protein BJ878DRAFT_181862 [Calycina marina]|uniref:Secreted protein n=1 Tax=Calycina marina TaxID=1763456 RepID=A0A9P8CJE1_9HELO|nr:hypothetical protein BJ878DRAFT_181862 [Calycina marina]